MLHVSEFLPDSKLVDEKPIPKSLNEVLGGKFFSYGYFRVPSDLCLLIQVDDRSV
jgi:hypothetical protein